MTTAASASTGSPTTSPVSLRPACVRAIAPPSRRLRLQTNATRYAPPRSTHKCDIPTSRPDELPPSPTAHSDRFTRSLLMVIRKSWSAATDDPGRWLRVSRRATMENPAGRIHARTGAGRVDLGS
jgi:hypothetical protein